MAFGGSRWIHDVVGTLSGAFVFFHPNGVQQSNAALFCGKFDFFSGFSRHASSGFPKRCDLLEGPNGQTSSPRECNLRWQPLHSMGFTYRKPGMVGGTEAPKNLGCSEVRVVVWDVSFPPPRMMPASKFERVRLRTPKCECKMTMLLRMESWV